MPWLDARLLFRYHLRATQRARRAERICAATIVLIVPILDTGFSKNLAAIVRNQRDPEEAQMFVR